MPFYADFYPHNVGWTFPDETNAAILDSLGRPASADSKLAEPAAEARTRLRARRQLLAEHVGEPFAETQPAWRRRVLGRRRTASVCP